VHLDTNTIVFDCNCKSDYIKYARGFYKLTLQVSTFSVLLQIIY